MTAGRLREKESIRVTAGTGGLWFQHLLEPGDLIHLQGPRRTYVDQTSHPLHTLPLEWDITPSFKTQPNPTLLEISRLLNRWKASESSTLSR